jgi:putative colanic acid biosynthesis acetyltransferase WcaF
MISRESPHSFANKCLRVMWAVVYALCFRPSPIVAHAWRRTLLRLFGAKIESGAIVHASVVIWAPWNLTMREGACMAPHVDCYSVGSIEVGRYAVVSQYSYLCSATHDHRSLNLPLVVRPIIVGDYAWVCANVFVGPGVKIGEGAVVGACSAVFRDVPPWMIVAGSPVRPIRPREVEGRCPQL